MKVKLGMIVESKFGSGEVLCISKKWVIHNDSVNGNPSDEYAIYIEDELIWIPVDTLDKNDSKLKETEI